MFILHIVIENLLYVEYSAVCQGHRNEKIDGILTFMSQQQEIRYKVGWIALQCNVLQWGKMGFCGDIGP